MLPSEESFFTLLFAFPDGGWKSDQMCELRTFFKSVGLRIWCLVGGMEWWALLHSILQWHQVCWMPSEFVYLSFNSGFKGDSLPKKQRNNFKSGVYILDQICIAAVIVCNSATLAILFVSWNHSRASIWCCDVCECFSLLKPFVSVTWVTCWSAAKKHSRGRDFWKQCRAAELGNARCFDPWGNTKLVVSKILYLYHVHPCTLIWLQFDWYFSDRSKPQTSKKRHEILLTQVLEMWDLHSKSAKRHRKQLPTVHHEVEDDVTTTTTVIGSGRSHWMEHFHVLDDRKFPQVTDLHQGTSAVCIMLTRYVHTANPFVSCQVFLSFPGSWRTHENFGQHAIKSCRHPASCFPFSLCLKGKVGKLGSYWSRLK